MTQSSKPQVPVSNVDAQHGATNAKYLERLIGKTVASVENTGSGHAITLVFIDGTRLTVACSPDDNREGELRVEVKGPLPLR